MKRRTFLGYGATLSFAATQALGAQDANPRRLLVLLLRGGMDGLCAVPPIGDPQLKVLRKGLIPERLLPAGDFFAIHPALPTFAQLLEKKEAMVVHAAGFGYTGRSHFEGQDIMQSGVAKPFTSTSGWLGRAMQKAKVGSGVAISIPIPLILRGDPLADTQYPTWMPMPPLDTYSLVRDMWSGDADLADIGVQLTGQKSEMLAIAKSNPMQMNAQLRAPKNLAYQAGLRMARSDGPVVGLIDFVGFDTHAAQGADEGLHASKLKLVDEVLASFKDTMGARWKDTLVLTVTEFGRQNGTSGTDHGWASCILAAGGLVAAGGVVADWPGLSSEKLFEGRDLPATIDANAVYAQALKSVFNLTTSQVQESVLTYRPHRLVENLFR